MSDTPVLLVDLISKSYHDDEVLGAINFTVNAGERIALLGPSGSGKTTLLGLIAGLDMRYNGTILTNAHIGMVFQEPTLLPWRSALDNITIATNCTLDEAHAVLKEFQLSGKEQLYPGQLSLGQQRRLALARAFASKAEFLIMDEPFTSLDEALVDELLEFTKSVILGHSMTSLLVTHSPREANYLADRILRLEGKPARIRDDG